MCGMNFATRYISNVYNKSEESCSAASQPKACKRLVRGRKVFHDKLRRIRLVKFN